MAQIVALYIIKIAFSKYVNSPVCKSVSPSNNICIPVNFAKEHKTMISHLAQLLDGSYESTTSHAEKFSQLIMS